MRNSRHLLIGAVICCGLIGQFSIWFAWKQFFAEHYSNLAHVQAGLGQKQVALVSAERSRKLNPLNPYTHYQVATSKLELDRPGEAVESFSRAEPLMPHLPNIFRFRGQANLQLQKYAEAASDFRRYFELVPEPVTLRGQLMKFAGLSQMQNDNPGAATYWLVQAANDPETSVESHRLAANTSILMAQPVTAVFSLLFLQQAVGQIRGPELLRNAIAGQSLPVLIETLETLQAYGPARDVATLAAAHARTGNYDRAIDLLKPESSKADANPELLLLLADLYYQAKRFPDAFQYYDAYLKKVPESPMRQDIQRRRALQPQ